LYSILEFHIDALFLQQFVNDEKTQKHSDQNHLSDVEMSPSGHGGMSEDDEDEELDEEKGACRCCCLNSHVVRSIILVTNLFIIMMQKMMV
jgi:hypothetical protein